MTAAHRPAVRSQEESRTATWRDTDVVDTQLWGEGVWPRPPQIWLPQIGESSAEKSFSMFIFDIKDRIKQMSLRQEFYD